MFYSQPQIMHTDVLVIGSGSAAARAALESARLGAKTTIVTKGKFGFSGTSCFHVAEAAGFSASGFDDESDSPEQHLADIMEAALGTCSAELAKIVAYEAPRQVRFLETLGIKFERYKDGYLATQGCFATKRRSIKVKGHGVPIVGVLRQEILRRGDIRIIENCMVADLIVEAEVCHGAYACLQDGSVYEIRAKSTILGTGGAGQLFSQSLNPQDVTGDGYAMGYRAGAKLVNMEFMQAGFGIAEPAKTVFNLWIWALSPRIFDEKNQEFLEASLPAGISIHDCVAAKTGRPPYIGHYPFSTRDPSKYLEIAVQRHRNAGGEVYADLRHVRDISREELEKIDANVARMWPITKAWMIRKGADVDHEPVPLVCYAHAFNGGLLIDRNAQTTVEHLYAVGEVSGGYHGADRLGGNMFASGQVFGEIAGRHAAQTALTMQDDSSRARPYFENPDTQAGACGYEKAVQIRLRLQKLSTAALLIIRNAQGLKRYLAQIRNLADELNKCRACAPVEYFGIQETQNLLTTGYLMASGARERNESRGSHYREDYPEPDDDVWRKVIIQYLQNGVPSMIKTEL